VTDGLSKLLKASLKLEVDFFFFFFFLCPHKSLTTKKAANMTDAQQLQKENGGEELMTSKGMHILCQ
jgi:hypothetical protein